MTALSLETLQKISQLKPGVKDPNRINIFVNHKFLCSLSFKVFSEQNLKVGDVLTEERIAELVALSSLDKLYQSTLEYCLSRPHSEKEIRDYLHRKQLRRRQSQIKYDNFKKRLAEDEEYRTKIQEMRKNVRTQNEKIREIDFTENNTYEYTGRKSLNLPTKPGAEITETQINLVVERLKQEKFLSDYNFTRFYIDNRNQSKGISRKKLLYELKSKGISESLAREVLESDELFSQREDDTEIDKIIEKKLRRPITQEKLMAYLVRQGFSYDLIKSKLSAIESENLQSKS